MMHRGSEWSDLEVFEVFSQARFPSNLERGPMHIQRTFSALGALKMRELKMQEWKKQE